MATMAPRAVPLDVERLLAQSGWARRLARRLVQDQDQAEDVLQETWVAALERPPAEDALALGFTSMARRVQKGWP
jgi:DNA-directed RNA polymerase specialized sigma24 family protein